MLRLQLAGLPEGYVADVAVIIVGGNDVTHRIRPAASRRQLAEAIECLHAQGTAVVLGTCPDLSALGALPQPLRTLAGVASRQLAAVQRTTVTELGGLAVSLADVVGPFFVTRPDEMFAMDRFHPSSAGFRGTAKAVLPSVLVALGVRARAAFRPPRPDCRVALRVGPAARRRPGVHRWRPRGAR